MDKEIEKADFPMTQKSGENLLFHYPQTRGKV